MSFVGTGNTFGTHWSGKDATNFLLKNGYTEEQIKDWKPRKRISEASGKLWEQRMKIRRKEINL